MAGNSMIGNQLAQEYRRESSKTDCKPNKKLTLLKKESESLLKLLTNSVRVIGIVRIVPVHVRLAIVVQVQVRHITIAIARALLFLYILVTERLLPNRSELSRSSEQ